MLPSYMEELIARTIRKAREQVKAMVKDGISTQKISRYLHRFVIWWVKHQLFGRMKNC